MPQTSLKPCSQVLGRFGSIGGAALGHHRDGLDQAALDLRHRRAGECAEIVDAPADQVLHRRPAAAIRHMGDVEGDRGVQQRAVDEAGRARAGGAELHLGLLALA